LSRTLLRLMATAWLASVVVYLWIALTVARGDDAFWFFLGAAFAVTIGAVTAHRLAVPGPRGVVIGLVAGATLGLAMVGVLSVGIYLLPAVGLWWAAAAVQARDGVSGQVAAGAVAGFALMIALVLLGS
jgi:hypothetical protein